MKTRMIAVALSTIVVCAGSAAAAGLPWNDHARPFGFLFGNEIDGHQQTQLRRNGELSGFLYVHFTGVVTQDGYRVATHVDCSTVSDCTAGWTLLAKPRTATFLYHPMDDHPVFLMSRSEIPQPGAFAHFHRTGPDPESSGPGYLLSLFAIDRFCFIHHDADSAVAGASCEENGGVAVTPGVDIATHLNIVTSAPPSVPAAPH